MDFRFDLPTEQDEIFWFADDLESSNSLETEEDEVQEPLKGAWQLEVEFMMRLA